MGGGIINAMILNWLAIPLATLAGLFWLIFR